MSTPPAARRRRWRQALGLQARAARLPMQAESLRTAFDRSFWCDDIGTYALALDGQKRPCRVRASNAGQCLFGGIVEPRRVPHVARGAARRRRVFGMGRSNARRRASPLQPDGLPHRRGLAARQRAHRPGARQVRLRRRSDAHSAGDVRGEPAFRSAAHAGAVLRIRTGDRRSTGAVPPGVRTAGLGGRFCVAAPAGRPRPSRRRLQSSGRLLARRVFRTGWRSSRSTVWRCATAASISESSGTDETSASTS